MLQSLTWLSLNFLTSLEKVSFTITLNYIGAFGKVRLAKKIDMDTSTDSEDNGPRDKKGSDGETDENKNLCAIKILSKH